MTGPLPLPGARLTKVRVLPTAAGAWRVRYRLDGKRRSSCAFPDREQADAHAATLRERFPDTPAAQANPTTSAPTVQGDEHDQH